MTTYTCKRCGIDYEYGGEKGYSREHCSSNCDYGDIIDAKDLTIRNTQETLGRCILGLHVEMKEVKDLLRQMDTYLEINNLTSINSGSLFHQLIKEVLQTKKGEVEWSSSFETH